MGLAPEKASRIKAWLQGRQPYLATPDPWSNCGHTSSIRNNWIWDQLVSVPNVSWMVAILVHRHVPILDNGGTGLTDPWLLYHSPINIWYYWVGQNREP